MPLKRPLGELKPPDKWCCENARISRHINSSSTVQRTLTNFLNPFRKIWNGVICLQIFLHLFYRDIHFISGINLLIISHLVSSRQSDILPIVSRVSYAQIGVISDSKHLLLAYNGTEEKNICLLLYYAASNKNAKEALELKINHNLKH